MDSKYIAVDLGRQRILIIANSMAELNRLILSQRGQSVIKNKQYGFIELIVRH